MKIRPGERYVVDGDGIRRTRDAYPTPSEPHCAADLLRPLATDNARLRRENDALVEQCADLVGRVLQLEARAVKSERLLLALTPGGSEFVYPDGRVDAQRCFEWAASRGKATVAAVLAGKQAEARVVELEARLEALGRVPG